MIARSIAVVAASSALVFGCHSSRSGDTQSNSSTTETQVAISSVPEVAHLLQSKGAVVLDANGEGTRREYGTVPGAVLCRTTTTMHSLSSRPTRATSWSSTVAARCAALPIPQRRAPWPLVTRMCR